MTDQQAKDRSVAMFRDATPTSPDAPISQWRDGFEAMADKIDLPSYLNITATTIGGVAGLTVAAPGVCTDRLVVHFHSGGYVMGSARAYREFAGRLSAACDAPVFVPDYRLAPEHPYPAAADDGLAIYAALLHDRDAGSIMLSGDSAGGGLCIATLMAARDTGLPRPAGAIAICPLLDLAGEGASADIDSDPLIDRNLIVGMGKVYIEDRDPHQHPLASPLWGDHRDLSPLFLIASSSEALRDDAVRMAASIGQARGQVRLSLYPDLVHIWTFFPFIDASRQALDEMAGFARECWRNAAPSPGDAIAEPGYLMVQARIDDPAGFTAYAEAVRPLIAAYGGQIVVRATSPVVLEGDWPWQTAAVLRFPSAAAVRAFWDSPEYTQIKALREGSAQFQAVLVCADPS